ncbi:hypothetical protein OF375_00450 [Ureaplasma miroungigenitalium]|uniref:hypothetical protein n=1 Tax=Ureaplasma miroungigenitalium TaxID=1042321 RepID=UPI0021E736F3|nr:hypothetical protein [Ureaplasma miroungigenitalium]MCV3734064.1 hypothetical protein [Ureaplasma miroungigenitalium]
MKISKKLLISASAFLVGASALIATTLLIHEKFASLKKSYLYTVYTKMHTKANQLAKTLDLDMAVLNQEYQKSWKILDDSKVDVVVKLQLMHEQRQKYTDGLMQAINQAITNGEFNDRQLPLLIDFLRENVNFVQEQDLRQAFLANDLVDLKLIQGNFLKQSAEAQIANLQLFNQYLSQTIKTQDEKLFSILNNPQVSLSSLITSTEKLGSYAVANEAINYVNSINALAMNKDYRVNEFNILMHNLNQNVQSLEANKDADYVKEYNDLANSTYTLVFNKLQKAFGLLASELKTIELSPEDEAKIADLDNDFKSTHDLKMADYFYHELQRLNSSLVKKHLQTSEHKEYTRLADFYNKNFVLKLNQTTTAADVAALRTEFEKFVTSLKDNKISGNDLVANFVEGLEYIGNRLEYLQKPFNDLRNKSEVQKLINNQYTDRTQLLDIKFKYENELNALRFADQRIALFKQKLNELIAKDLITPYQEIAFNQKIDQLIQEYKNSDDFIAKVNQEILGLVDLLNVQSSLLILKDQLLALKDLYHDTTVVFNKYYNKPILDQVNSLLFTVEQDLISFKVEPTKAIKNVKNKWENTRYLLRHQLQYLHDKVALELSNLNPRLINKDDFQAKFTALNTTSKQMLEDFNPVTSMDLWAQINKYTNLLNTYELVVVYAQTNDAFENNDTYIRRLFNDKNVPDYTFSPSEQTQIDSLNESKNNFAAIKAQIENALNNNQTINNVNDMITQMQKDVEDSDHLRDNAQAIKDITNTVESANELITAINNGSSTMKAKLQGEIAEINNLKQKIVETLKDPNTTIDEINALNKQLATLVEETNEKRKDNETLALISEIGRDLLKTYPNANLDNPQDPNNSPGAEALLTRLNELKKRASKKDLTDEQKVLLLKDAKSLSDIMPLVKQIEDDQALFDKKVQEYNKDDSVVKQFTVGAISNFEPTRNNISQLLNLLGSGEEIPEQKEFYNLISNPTASDPTKFGLEEQINNIDLAFNHDRIQTYNDKLQGAIYNEGQEGGLSELETQFNDKIKNQLKEYAQTGIDSTNLVEVQKIADTLNDDQTLQAKLKEAIELHKQLLKTSPLDAIKLQEQISNNMFSETKKASDQIRDLDAIMKIVQAKANLRAEYKKLDSLLSDDEKNWKIYNDTSKNLNADLKEKAKEIDALYLQYNDSNKNIQVAALEKALTDLQAYVQKTTQEKQVLLDNYNNSYNEIKDNVINGAPKRENNILVGGLDTELNKIDPNGVPNHEGYKHYNDVKRELEDAYSHKSLTNSEDLKTYKDKLIYAFQQDLLLNRVKTYEQSYEQLKQAHPNADYAKIDAEHREFVEFMNNFANDKTHTLQEFQDMAKRIDSYEKLNVVQIDAIVQLDSWKQAQTFASNTIAIVDKQDLDYASAKPSIEQAIAELEKIKRTVTNNQKIDAQAQAHLDELNDLIAKLTAQNANDQANMDEVKANLRQTANLLENNYSEANKNLRSALSNSNLGLNNLAYKETDVQKAAAALQQSIKDIDVMAGLRLTNKVAINIDWLTYIKNEANNPNNDMDVKLEPIVRETIKSMIEANKSPSATLDNLKDINQQINALIANKTNTIDLAKKVREGEKVVAEIKANTGESSQILQDYITEFEHVVNNIHANVYGKLGTSNDADSTKVLIDEANAELDVAIRNMKWAQQTHLKILEAKKIVEQLDFNGTDGIDRQTASKQTLMNWLDVNIAPVIDDQQALVDKVISYLKTLKNVSDTKKTWKDAMGNYIGYQTDVNSLTTLLAETLPTSQNQLIPDKTGNEIGNSIISNALDQVMVQINERYEGTKAINAKRVDLNQQVNAYVADNSSYLAIKENYVNLSANIDVRLDKIRGANNFAKTIQEIQTQEQKLSFLIDLSADLKTLADQINEANIFIDSASPIDEAIGKEIQEFKNTDVINASELFALSGISDLDSFKVKIQDSIKRLAFQQARLKLLNESAQMKFNLSNNDNLTKQEKTVISNRLDELNAKIKAVDQNAADATAQFEKLRTTYLKPTLSSYKQASADNDSIVLSYENANNLRKMISVAEKVYANKVNNDLNKVVDGKFVPENDQTVIKAYDHLNIIILAANKENQKTIDRDEARIREYYQVLIPQAIKAVYKAKMESYQKLLQSQEKLVEAIEAANTGINALLASLDVPNKAFDINKIKEELAVLKTALAKYDTYNEVYFAQNEFSFNDQSITKTDAQTWNVVQKQVLDKINKLIDAIDLRAFNETLRTGISTYSRQLTYLFNTQNANVINTLNQVNNFVQQTLFADVNNPATKAIFAKLQALKTRLENEFVKNNALNNAEAFYNNQYTSLEPLDFINLYLQPTTSLIVEAKQEVAKFVEALKSDVHKYIRLADQDSPSAGFLYEYMHFFVISDWDDAQKNPLLKLGMQKAYALYTQKVQPNYQVLAKDLQAFDKSNDPTILANYYNQLFVSKNNFTDFINLLKESLTAFYDKYEASKYKEITGNLYKIDASGQLPPEWKPYISSQANENADSVNNDLFFEQYKAVISNYFNNQILAKIDANQWDNNNGSALTASTLDAIKHAFSVHGTTTLKDESLTFINAIPAITNDTTNPDKQIFVEYFYQLVNLIKDRMFYQIKRPSNVNINGETNANKAMNVIKPKDDVNWKVFVDKLAKIKPTDTKEDMDVTQNAQFLDMFQEFAFTAIDKKSMFNPNSLRVKIKPAYDPTLGPNNRTYCQVQELDQNKPGERILKFKIYFEYKPSALIDFAHFKGWKSEEFEVNVIFKAKDEIAAISGTSAIFTNIVDNQVKTGHDAKVLVANSDELNWAETTEDGIVQNIINAFKKQVLKNENDGAHKIIDYSSVDSVDTTDVSMKFSFNTLFVRSQFSQIGVESDKQILHVSVDPNNKELSVLVSVPAELSTSATEYSFLQNNFFKVEGNKIVAGSQMPSALLINMKFAFEWDTNTHDIYMYNSWYELHNVMKYPGLKDDKTIDINEWVSWDKIKFARFMLENPFDSDANHIGAWLNSRNAVLSANQTATLINVEQQTIDGTRQDLLLRDVEKKLTQTHGYFIVNPRTGTYLITHGTDIKQTSFNDVFKSLNLFNSGIVDFKFKIR